MDVSGHQLDFILLHIWQEIPHAPTPTVSSTDLPHNARVEPKYLKERARRFLREVWRRITLLAPNCRRGWFIPLPKHHSVLMFIYSCG